MGETLGEVILDALVGVVGTSILLSSSSSVLWPMIQDCS